MPQRIRSDEELLDEFCRMMHVPKDRGLRRAIEETEEYRAWAKREASKDVLKEADRLMSY